METSVCLIKPDAVSAGASDRIIGAIETAGFFVVRRADFRFTPTRARAFYQHLEGQPQYRITAEFASSGPAVALLLSRVDAVRTLRELCGPSDPAVARDRAPTSLRAQYGTDQLRNAVHASDGVPAASREQAFLFPQGPLQTLVPKEYLLETAVLPGLVEALGELYVAQPDNPYTWMAHWFQTNQPPPRDMLMEWPEPLLAGRELESDNIGQAFHNKALGAPMYEGTWNFRRCKDRDPVYGLGQGLAGGCRAVAEGLFRSGHRRILWVYLREDPIVFVAGTPVSLRPSLGVPSVVGTAEELPRLERRLKQDVLSVSLESGGSVSMHVDDGGGMEDDRVVTQTVREEGLLTPTEVFVAQQAEGLPVEFARVPVPEEGPPSERTLERLLEHALEVDTSAAVVLSCRTGMGRTTVAMCVSCVVWRVRSGAELEGGAAPYIDVHNPNYDRAEFEAVIEMVEGLGGLGRVAKQRLDEAVDRCNALLDLRACILECRRRAERDSRRGGAASTPSDGPFTPDRFAHSRAGAGGPGPDVWVRRGLLCLERYLQLLLFTAYLMDQAPYNFQQRFSTWVRHGTRWHLRPEGKHFALH